MNGTPVTDPIFYQTGTFSEGAAFVKEKYNEPGYYIDTLGNKLFSGTFEYGGWFKNGFAAVQQDGKYGIIDKKGNFLIPPSLDGISVFNECRFFVYWKMKRGKIHYGLINLKGEFITRPIYSSTLINDGDCIFPELYYKGKDSYDYSTKLGYVNRQGKVIWKPKN